MWPFCTLSVQSLNCLSCQEATNWCIPKIFQLKCSKFQKFRHLNWNHYDLTNFSHNMRDHILEDFFFEISLTCEKYGRTRGYVRVHANNNTIAFTNWILTSTIMYRMRTRSIGSVPNFWHLLVEFATKVKDFLFWDKWRLQVAKQVESNNNFWMPLTKIGV